jgi:hypothetical protein
MCLLVSVNMATSLANTVSTRADSSSRHMLQCRVHRDRLLGWTPSRCNNGLLQTNKHVYSLTKDELAIEVSRSMDKGSDHYSHRSQPYPMVLSSFEGMSQEAQNVYACLMSTDTPFNTHRTEIFNKIKSPHFKGTLGENEMYHIKTIPYFKAMGYSVGTAYAHENSGDTIASVMIGGITTVLNGDFPMQTGDRVMWYLAKSEVKQFSADGVRHTISPNDTPNPMRLVNGVLQDFTYNDVANFINNTRVPSGAIKADEKAIFNLQRNGFALPGTHTKNNIALIKPFHFKNASDGDYERVFATCISPADKFEMVDIMISRQAL